MQAGERLYFFLSSTKVLRYSAEKNPVDFMLMHGWDSWQPESQQAEGKAVTDGHG